VFAIAVFLFIKVFVVVVDTPAPARLSSLFSECSFLIFAPVNEELSEALFVL
jgi:hypothetical protein